MKRILSILLLSALLLSGCQSQKPKQNGTPYQFYYPSAEPSSQGTLLAHTVYLPKEISEVQVLLEQYLQTKAPENACAAIPAGWQLHSCTVQTDHTLVLYFSGSVATPIEESVAAVCLFQTLFQHEGVQQVELHAPGRTNPQVVSADSFLLEDTGMLPPQEQIVLYYPDEKLRFLQRETLLVDAMTVEEKAHYIVQQLLAVNADGKTRSGIPAQTRLLGLQLKNGTCILDLSSEFVNGMPQRFAVERAAIYSLVNSLTELEEIDTVELWVSHAPLDRLFRMDLRSGLLRDASILQPPEDSTEGTIYPCATGSGLLVAVPISLPEDDSKTYGTLLVEALLAYEGSNGIASCIPKGTELFTLQISEQQCVVDLSAEFLNGCPNEDAEQMAVRSIVATVSTIPSVQSVEILIEGISPDYSTPNLAQEKKVQSAWISE